MILSFKIKLIFIFLLCHSILLGQDYRAGIFEWSKEDLTVTQFRNGDPIFHAQSDEEWEQASNEGKPAYCFVQGDQSKGVLYNWFAVNDPRGLAPQGYRLPSTDDFEKLISSGIELKSNKGNWTANNIAGNSEFNATSKGYRSFDGSSFLSQGYLNYYWSNEKGKALYAYRFGLFAEQSPLIDEGRREDGYSVRLIRDFEVSVLPSQIFTPKKVVKPKEKVVLKLNDGALGKGANFYWFKGECNNSVNNSFASGRVIECVLNETTVISVGIFKGDKRIGCKSIKIEVKDVSVLPSSIKGDDWACEGGYIDLYLNDGELCSTCDWYWYNTPDFSGPSIGVGDSISVRCFASNTYYVLSKSKTSRVVTEAISKNITIYSVPPDPLSINYISGTELCNGDLFQCSVNGPELENSKWVWEYEGKIVEGKNLNVFLNNSSSIKVYSKNICGKSLKSISGFIIVNTKTVSPSSILFGKESGKSYLTQNGGVKGTGSEWQWYRMKTNKKKKYIGKGDKVYINPRKSYTYFVRSEGGKCESNSLVQYNYHREPKEIGKSTWSPEYSNSSGWLHFGTDLGLGLSLSNDKINKWDTVNYFSKSGYDLIWNLNTHLINKEFFILGFTGGLAGGLYQVPENNYLFREMDSLYNINLQEYFTLTGRIGAELLIGFVKKGKAKLLINYNQAITYNDLSFRYSNSQVENFNYFLNNEVIGLGLRLGSNAQIKKSKQLDVILTLHDINNNGSFLLRDYTYFGNRQMGLQCNLWVHSVMKITTGLLFSNLLKDYNAGNFNLTNAYIGINYSLDRFR